MGEVHLYRHQQPDGSHGLDAARQFQRIAGSRQYFLPQDRSPRGPQDRPAISGQHHSSARNGNHGLDRESQWSGDTECLSAAESDYTYQRQPKLVFLGAASAVPAEGHLGHRSQPDRKAAATLPPRVLHFLGVSTAGWWNQRDAEVFRSPQPDQLD